MLSIALEGEAKALGFISRLNASSVLPGRCPLFLRFLIALIELILWLSFPIDKRQAEDMEGRI